MNTRGLSLDQAPPIGVPFRFFLAAPPFALAAAAVVWAAGDAAFRTRWAPATLAATHALTLGFMGLVMIGALLQMLPVVAGSPVPRPSLVAWLVHPPLVGGTALLVAGFAASRPELLAAGAIVLGVGLAAFMAAAAWSLARVPRVNVTVTAMRLSIVALVVTVVLALVLVRTWVTGAPLPAIALRELHPIWGLAGWTALLVIGVAYQVVPMFQMTPPYPPRIARLFAPICFVLLLARSFAPEGLPKAAASWLVAAAAVAFAALTFFVQAKRRRRTRDVTLDFWRLSMGSLAAAAVAWASGRVPEVTIGVLAIAGFVVSVITGMLYKIVPFLSWFHLQARALGRTRVPIMKDFLPDAPQRLQFALHAVALAALVAATLWPQVLFRPALALFFASMVVLWRNLLVAHAAYRRVARELERLPAPASAA